LSLLSCPSNSLIPLDLSLKSPHPSHLSSPIHPSPPISLYLSLFAYLPSLIPLHSPLFTDTLINPPSNTLTLSLIYSIYSITSSFPTHHIIYILNHLILSTQSLPFFLSSFLSFSLYHLNFIYPSLSSHLIVSHLIVSYLIISYLIISYLIISHLIPFFYSHSFYYLYIQSLNLSLLISLLVYLITLNSDPTHPITYILNSFNLTLPS
jgi:hypothetical protein